MKKYDEVSTKLTKLGDRLSALGGRGKTLTEKLPEESRKSLDKAEESKLLKKCRIRYKNLFNLHNIYSASQNAPY